MEFSGPSATRSAIRPLSALATALFAALIVGCASPGPARPPSLHLPRLATEVTASRTGDDVTLHWTTSDKTTDGLKIQSPITAEICRELPAHPATCDVVKRLTVHPGPSSGTETLPANLTADSATLLIYRVRLLNTLGHSAGLSSPTFAAAGAAPPQIQGLKVTPVRNGAMIEWQPQPVPSVIDLDRILVQTTAPKKTAAKKPLQPTLATPVEVHLQAGRQSADPGGTIDPTAQRGETYRYTAQRVRSITLNGHALEIRSTPSTTITAVMRDIFPPHAPTGLAAIANDNTAASRSIDLSWEPNTEPGLAGYIVYRQQVAPDGTLAGTPARLTSAPVPSPAFSDLTAQVGQTYSYRVVAIDTSGNQSPASAAARESLRNQ